MENLSSVLIDGNHELDNSSTISFLLTNNNNGHSCKLDNLPDLVNYHILKHLHLDDIWNLRLINKRFCAIVYDYSIIEIGFSYFTFKSNWFSTTRPSKLENQLHDSKLGLLRSPLVNLLNLKYLRINSDSLDTNLNDLNKFTKLQVLELGNIKLNRNHLLQLPDLKALSFKISDGEFVLAIDTPQLHSLHIHNLGVRDLIDDKIKFSYPHSIKCLILHGQEKNMSIFKNLETLELLYHNWNVVALKSDLSNFNCLKKLKFANYPGNELLDALKDLFRWKKDDLEMALCGVRIKEISKLDEWRNTSNRLEFQLNNYNELEDDLNIEKEVNYSKLVSLLRNNEPADLFTKYTNIQCVYIFSQIEDENRLMRFIRKCKSLNHLSIDRSSLSQQFYDQLPSSLLQLIIKNDAKDLNLNFKFLLNMPYLRYLSTNQNVLLDEELNLNNFKLLNRFEFKIKGIRIKIIKEDRDLYLLDNVLHTEVYYTYEELVNYIFSKF